MRSDRGTRALPYVGAALVFLGIACILLGWHGAANTPLVFEQLPYLISGGQLGTALVTLGALLYFAYWLAVLVRDQRETHSLLKALLAERQVTVPAQHLRLVATTKGNMAHLPDCPVVRSRDDTRPVSPTEELASCGICQPA